FESYSPSPPMVAENRRATGHHPRPVARDGTVPPQGLISAWNHSGRRLGKFPCARGSADLLGKSETAEVRHVADCNFSITCSDDALLPQIFKHPLRGGYRQPR